MASKCRQWLDISAAVLVSLGVCSFLLALIREGMDEALINEGFIALAVAGAMLLGIARIFHLVEEMNGGMHGRSVYRPSAGMR